MTAGHTSKNTLCINAEYSTSTEMKRDISGPVRNSLEKSVLMCHFNARGF